MTITPVVLDGLSLTPNPVIGGGPVTGNLTLSGPAPAGGLPVSLNSSLSSAAVPVSVTVPAGQVSQTFSIATTARTSPASPVIKSAAGGVSLTSTLSITPLLVTQVTVPSAGVIGGLSFPVHIQINGKAPAAGATIHVSSSDARLVVPATVVVASGQTFADFTATTQQVTANLSVTIATGLSGVRATGLLTILPPNATLTVSPTPTYAGGPVTGKITLRTPAPANGVTYSLASDNAGVSVPRTVAVPAGSSLVTFPVTIPATTTGVAHVTATLSGVVSSVTVTVQAFSGLATSAWPKFGADQRNSGRGRGFGASGILSAAYAGTGLDPSNQTPGYIATPYFAIGSDGSLYFQNLTGIMSLTKDGKFRWYRTGLMTGPNNAPVIGPDGTIYIAGGSLLAMTPSGTVKWNVALASFGGVSHAPPAIGTDGTIYICVGDALFAFNANGTVKWNYIPAGAGNLCSPAVGPGNNIFFATLAGQFYSVNPAGTLNWTYTAAAACEHGAAPGIAADGTSYFATVDHLVTAMSPTGVKKWAYTEGFVTFTPALVGPDGTIYEDCDDDNLYAINPDGTKKWTAAVGNGMVQPVLGPDGTVHLSRFAINPDGSTKWVYPSGYGASSVAPDGTVYMVTDITTNVDIGLAALNSAGAVQWTLPVGAFSCSPCIGPDGTQYVGDDFGFMYAFAADGTLKWTYGTQVTNLYNTPVPIQSTPVIGADGTIYFLYDENYLYALTSSGTLKWRFLLKAMNYNFPLISSSPQIAPDGTIYVGGLMGNLYAVTPAGKIKWTFTTSEPVQSSPVMGTDSTLYVGCFDGHVYAVNSDGSPKWQKSMIAGASSPALGSNGLLYIGAMDGNVYALETSAGNTVYTFNAASTVSASPAIAPDGTVYITSDDQILHALNADLTVKWNYAIAPKPAKAPLQTATCAIGGDGTVYVSGSAGLNALSPTGTLKWVFGMEQTVTSPAIGADGKMYIGGWIYYAIK